ncbi:MAG: hypothetical protein ACO1OB_05600 [Archangium sp.]
MLLRLLDGDIRCTRIFDVADTIDLEKCRERITAGGGDIRRLSLRREGSEYIQLSDPPLLISLGSRQFVVSGASREVKLDAALFHHGAISISVRVPLMRGATVEELIPVADELYDSKSLDALALEEVNKLRATLGDAVEAGHLWEQNESYTVIFAREFEGAPSADLVLRSPGIARLLLGEQREKALSKLEEAEVLEHHFSYTPNDLVLIEWNAALVYEPSGSEDIVDLLEIANAQLLELRYYDNVLDAELQRMYGVVGMQDGGNYLLKSPYKAAIREQLRTLIELSEFIERVENATKIVGDVYLARVYESALKQLRISKWTEQVSRKHKLLQQIYGLLKGEVDTGRALTLETMVVLLILIEILMAVWRVGH